MSGETSRARASLFRPGHCTFFGAPFCDDVATLAADVGVIGVPYDFGTIVPFLRTGSSRGPAAVRANPTYFYYGKPFFTGQSPGAVGWFDVENERDHLVGVTIADCGDVNIAAADIETNLDRITSAARLIVDRGAVVAAVGGDHSISFPVGRGATGPFEEVDLVQFDAHPDFADEAAGSRYSHGSNLRRLSELPNIRNITVIGLRNMSREHFNEMRDRGVRIITSKKLVEEGAAVVERVVPPTRHMYLSIDTDVLDAGLVPGTTLPEPAGLSYRLLREAVEIIASKGTVVGLDLVELSAPHDFGGASARVTSWVLTHALSAIFDVRRSSSG